MPYNNVGHESLLCETQTIIKKLKIGRYACGRNSYVLSTCYGRDMPDELACELLGDINFYYNKPCCYKIEIMFVRLRFNKIVEQQASIYKSLFPYDIFYQQVSTENLY